VTFNQGPTSGISDTINVNGAGAVSLLSNVGGDPSGYVGNTNPTALCYTSSSYSGSLTPSWRVMLNLGISGGGWMNGQAAGWVTSYATLLSGSYPGISLVAYEGGPGYDDPAPFNLADLTTYYQNMNLDSRMGTSLATYFTNWKNAGGQIFMYFNDAGYAGTDGSWGLAQQVSQTLTLPNEPKLNEWISWNQTVNCWWSGCSH
jgi:hypothetical protein